MSHKNTKNRRIFKQRTSDRKNSVSKSHYPIYTGRKGSETYFAIEYDAYRDNKEEIIKEICLYTLYMFGKEETEHIEDPQKCQLNLIDKKGRHTLVNLVECFNDMRNDRLSSKIFHLDQKIANIYFDKHKNYKCYDTSLQLCTNQKIKSPSFKSCDVYLVDEYINYEKVLSDELKRNVNEYPCMYDTMELGLVYGKHVIDCNSDIEYINDYYLDENEDVPYEHPSCDPSISYIVKRVSQWETGTEPHCDTYCNICTEQLKRSEISDLLDISNYNIKDCDDIINYNFNNLIFDFEKYQLNIEINNDYEKSDNDNNEYFHISFDTRAIGGYRHASFYTAAVFEVRHAVPNTLKQIQTTYVNSMDVKVCIKEVENKVYFTSTYKAIDVL